MLPLYIFDPTIRDHLSKVRGIGRYLQLLHDAFPEEIIFTGTLAMVPINSIFVNPFFDLFKPPLLMKRIARRQIAVIHDLIPLKYSDHFESGVKGKINIAMNNLALKNYDLILTDSHASKKDVITLLKIPEEKIIVISPALKPIFFQHLTSKIQDLRSKIQDPYFIYVGDATWNKNLVNIAKALRIINANCVFVGNVFTQPSTLRHPWQRELLQFTALVKLDNRFIFPGFVKDEELIYYYKNAIANLLVSRDEGFGFSYFEAASQKTPSILADRPIFHETAANTALFVDPEDPSAIAKAMEQMLSDKKLRDRLGNNAYERTQKFNVKTFREDFMKALEQIGSEFPTSPRLRLAS